jgi:hypothetical protein
MKTGGFEIGHDTEVAQGAEASGQTLSKLEQAVNRLDGTISEPGFQEGDNAAPMFLNALCQLTERFEPTELCALAPPAQGLLIFVGENVLEHVAQADGPTEFGIAIAQRASLLALLVATGPFIATQRPERSLQIGSCPGQFLTDLIGSLTSHLHEMKAVKDDLGLREELTRSALISRTHIHADEFDLFSLSAVGHQRLSEGFQSLSATAFDHQEKFMSFRVEHIGHVTMASPGTGFVNRDRSHLRPRVLGVGGFNIMGRHAPEPGIVLPKSICHRRHRHLAAQQHSQGLKKQRKAAAFPRPGHRYAQNSVFRAIAARHPSFQEALILEEVQMPPALDAGVMSRAKLAALWAAKAPALLEIQLQKQLAWFAFKSAFRHFPSRFELQGRRKQCFRCHPTYAVPPSPDLQGPAMRPLFVIQLRAPRASLKIKSYALTHSRQRGAKMQVLGPVHQVNL